MATISFSGTPSASTSYGFGSMTLPTPQSAREKVRAAAAYGIKNTISQANGYFNDIGEVNVQEIEFAHRKAFPSIDLLWGDEIYQNTVPGSNTTHLYEKVADLWIEAWLDDYDDMTLEKEKLIADIEKYFGTNYWIPDASGNRTAFNCMLARNAHFGQRDNTPKGGVSLLLKVYYRTPFTNPNTLA